MTWLRMGATFLVVSLICALLLPNGQTVMGNRTVFFLESWIERTALWLGLIFIAGHVLESVFGRSQNE